MREESISMINDDFGLEILKLLDRIRKIYGKSMKEKDKKDLIDLNKKLYDKVGGIVKDPMVRQNPLSKPFTPGGYQVSPVRQAESIDIQRLSQMIAENFLKAK